MYILLMVSIVRIVGLIVSACVLAYYLHADVSVSYIFILIPNRHTSNIRQPLTIVYIMYGVGARYRTVL